MPDRPAPNSGLIRLFLQPSAFSRYFLSVRRTSDPPISKVRPSAAERQGCEMKALLSTLMLLTCTSLASANVTVSGQGKVTYVPDIGYVTVGVSSKGKTAQEAWDLNNAVVKKLFDALKAHGIDPKDLQTSGLDIRPEYVHRKDQEPLLVGYSAGYDLKITVRKLGELGMVLDDLVKNGANRNVSIAFGCSNLEGLMDEARVKAIADAKKKAELYATGAGGKLGRVLDINETGTWRPEPYRLHLPEAKAVADTLQIAQGQQELKVSVQVVYGLDTAPPRALPVRE
jgi:uncharacterized protein YggE